LTHGKCWEGNEGRGGNKRVTEGVAKVAGIRKGLSEDRNLSQDLTNQIREKPFQAEGMAGAKALKWKRCGCLRRAVWLGGQGGVGCEIRWEGAGDVSKTLYRAP
jgi:hypothetical protein